MPKTKISEFSATPGNNTDIDGINIAEGCPPSGINDAIRELMSQLKDFQAGTAGDSFNGPVGTTTPAAGVFTNLSASGTFALTGDQVQISEGGTGQTTANAAFNALAPSQSTHAGKYLKTDGTNTSWDAIEINTADITGTLPVANGGTGVTSSTGTGSVVLSASPTFTGTVNGAALTLSSSLTLSGGTANGVAYLNGSKVLTTGSALTFDGTNLALGMSALAARVMTVRGRAAFVAPSTDSQLALYSDGTTNGIYSTYNSSGSYLPMTFYTADVERMRLTSGGDLGIGTSSNRNSTKLDVRGNISFGANASYYGQIGYDAGVGTLDITSGDGGFRFIRQSGLVTSATLDSSGNLGLGVTPSAWGGSYKAIEFPGISVANLNGGTNQQAQYLLNAYDSGAGAWKYKITGVSAAMYRQAADGAHEWHRAASGTAGNAISFTQALTLDADGNLMAGVTTSSYRIAAVVASGANRDVFQAGVSGASNGLTVKWNHATTTTRVNIANLPTSSAGLASGDLWNDSGTLKVA